MLAQDSEYQEAVAAELSRSQGMMVAALKEENAVLKERAEASACEAELQGQRSREIEAMREEAAQVLRREQEEAARTLERETMEHVLAACRSTTERGYAVRCPSIS